VRAAVVHIAPLSAAFYPVRTDRSANNPVNRVLLFVGKFPHVRHFKLAMLSV
jgi:hypothetical protein